MKRVSFRNKNIEVIGNIHTPNNFDESGTYPALVLATPGSSVAIGTVVANDIGAAFRNMQPRDELLAKLEAVGRQRAADARGAELRRDPWFPDSPKRGRGGGNLRTGVVRGH